MIGDTGKQLYFTAAANLTIPANASVAFPIGTAIAIATTASNVNVIITTDTLYLAGNTSGVTGNRVITGYGLATLTKVTGNIWYIGGAGVV